MFESILSSSTGTLSIENAFICIISALILGIMSAGVHMLTSKYSKNFIITLAVLPLLVQVVIIMVNGNLGTSVAIMGAFALIRFRSIPASSKEILMVFFSMAIGLATGMGHITYALMFTIVTSIIILISNKIKFTNQNNYLKLKVSIPEDLDFTTIFDDTFNTYTKSHSINKIKTTNMGSLYEITYDIELKDISEKEFIDDLRIHNGNLKIILSHSTEGDNDL